MHLNLSKQTREQLEKLFGNSKYAFLGYTLNLKTATINDNQNISELGNNEFLNYTFSTILTHYALSTPTQPTNRLIRFRDLKGGYAYEKAFIIRAINPIAQVFGLDLEAFKKATDLLCGVKLKYGDFSTQINALQGIPLTYILWKAEEFAANANILFDASANSYLPTEDLAVLGEITTQRIIQIASLQEIHQ